MSNFVLMLVMLVAMGAHAEERFCSSSEPPITARFELWTVKGILCAKDIQVTVYNEPKDVNGCIPRPIYDWGYIRCEAQFPDSFGQMLNLKVDVQITSRIYIDAITAASGGKDVITAVDYKIYSSDQKQIPNQAGSYELWTFNSSTPSFGSIQNVNGGQFRGAYYVVYSK